MGEISWYLHFKRIVLGKLAKGDVWNGVKGLNKHYVVRKYRKKVVPVNDKMDNIRFFFQYICLRDKMLVTNKGDMW